MEDMFVLWLYGGKRTVILNVTFHFMKDISISESDVELYEIGKHILGYV